MIRSILFLLLCLSTIQAFSQKETLKVNDLQCEYRENPLGVESPTPRLQWRLNSPQRNVVQTAYRVLVADSPEQLQKNKGNVWDSRKVKSNKSIQLAYAGKRLEPAKAYFWKVMVWDNKGNASWSEPAQWQMGLPTAQDWKGARWIAYEELPSEKRIVPAQHGKGSKSLDEGKNILPILRKEFTIANPVKRATAYISGLGHFEVSLNGEKVGDHFLAPGWTDYDEHALYVSYDITNQVNKGKNALGVMLGNGFYHIPRGSQYRKLTGSFGYPKMICRLVVEYQNGKTENIISDASWKTAPGPITFSSIYGGEFYDATLEQPGWNKPDFKENKAWRQVLLVEGPKLEAQVSTPVKLVQSHAPIKVTQPEPGKWVYDLGQNASGIVGIAVKGKKGATVKITPGELLNEQQLVTQKHTGSPYNFIYTLKGEGTETWQPRFSYYGFRYVMVEGSVPEGQPNPQGLPVMVALKGLHNTNAAKRVGQFATSKDLFNKTETLIDWAIRSNMQSVFTDCPHREKLGWQEEVHLVGSSIRYSYDIASMSRKLIRDMQMAQTKEGLIPNIAPEYVEFEFSNGVFRDSPEWGSNGIIFPWYLYQWYGDQQVLEEAYPMMQRYVEYLKSKSKNNLVSHGLSDWYDLGPERPGFSQQTPNGVTATAIYYYDLSIMGKIAALLGKPQDAKAYEQLGAEVKRAFNETFFNKETKQYATGSQTANAMAVYMKLVEPQYKEDVVNNIIKDIRTNKLTAGDVGYRYLLRVLDDAGRSDVIYDMNSRTDVPGYGYQLARGATALTESWQALPTVSNNHLMLGHILEWFYSGIGGIRQQEHSIAFNHIEIRPEIVGDLTFSKVTYDSPYGVISTDWKRNADTLELSVEIPANTTATVHLPMTATDQIFESGKLVAGNKDLQQLPSENGRAFLKVGSGTYHFVVQAKKEL
ncbi:family 78 glycoside hydrolase catalytic domain [Rufibacter tibetensis]|uniref:alpha-L-rhamnosidase n=1 Tax=Rufibacter tibetensis TaxID=512763 RepID=A0A0P0CY58_9BACT|nr:family 78 glycoside hydrolase catalytic domain [Rufibacter tibetensis]ALJ01746.1 alpha-L-rhamnosidase [Rufibacter tibetensis]